MQGRPLYHQQIPAPSDGQWPQTASFEQQPQPVFYTNGVAPGQGYLPPNQQPALPFSHQSLDAQNSATPHCAIPHGVCHPQPSQPPFMANSGHDPPRNPVHNPLQNPAPNPALNHMHNPLQNPAQNYMHNPVHNPYLSQHPPNGFLPQTKQPTNHERAAPTYQSAQPRGFASPPTQTTNGPKLGFKSGQQPATQGEWPPGPAGVPVHTTPYWAPNGPPGMQTAPNGRGPHQMVTGGAVRSARGGAIEAYAGNNGPPPLLQNGRSNPSQNQHRPSSTNHTRPDPTLQPNQDHSTKHFRSSSQAENRVNPSNTQQLESGERTGKSGGVLKRPADSQGGDWKRQRNEGVRVPGWKAKETEAVDVSDQFALEDVNKDVFKKAVEKETDTHRLKQRQKQIDFGKNTLGYERYLEQVPRFRRQKGDPQTPKISQVCSKRSWDGQIKKWRRLLHKYDLPVDDEAEFAEEEYVPGYRGESTGGTSEDAAAEQPSAEEEEPVTVEASVFEEDEDEFVGL